MSSKNSSSQIPVSLLQALANKEVVPFVGSGVSLGVFPSMAPDQPHPKAFPTWSGLLGKLADVLQGDDVDSAEIVRRYVKKSQLNKAADEAVEALGNSRFQRAMKGVFDIKEKPSDANLALPQALWSLQPKLMVTTNYERVLEWAHPKSQHITNSQHGNLADLFQGTPEAPKVWHLHGHIADPDSLILAPSQYEPLYRDAAPDSKHALHAAHTKLKTLISENTLLFVGFGLQDEYFMEALSTMLAAFRGTLRPSYALLHKNDSRARELWEKYNVQVISFNNYGAPLVTLVNELSKKAKAPIGTSEKRQAGPAAIPPGYKEWLNGQCFDITPLGIQPAQGQVARLNEIYVPSLTSRVFQSRSMDFQSVQNEFARTSADAESQRTQQPILHLLGERSLYLSGHPGTGKSTFCKWVAWLAAHGQMPTFAVETPAPFAEQLPATLKNRLPLLVKLREFRTSLPSEPGQQSLSAAAFQVALQEWVEAQKPGGLRWSDVEAHLVQGSLLLILDGVDEVPESEGEGTLAWSPRSSLLTGLLAAARDWMKAGNRLLLTSRPYGLRPDQVRQLEQAGLPEAAFDPLPDELQDLLAQRWFVALPKDGADGRETAALMLRDARQLSEQVAKLAANPLLLTALCIIYGDGKQLPKDMHDLYHRIVKTALHSRYDCNQTDIDRTRYRLAEVAWGMHSGTCALAARSSPVAEVGYVELNEILQRFINTKPVTESVLVEAAVAREELLNRSGLLSQNGAERASFYHLSFQEFLAAEWLVRKHRTIPELADVFRSRSAASGWRPTLSFLFGAVNEQDRNAASQLLSELQRSIALDKVADHLGLALVCADAWQIVADAKPNMPTQLEQFTQIVLQAIKQEVELKPRCELSRMLGRLGDPRIADDLRSTRDAIEDRRMGTPARLLLPSELQQGAAQHDEDKTTGKSAHPTAWVRISAGSYPYGDDNKPRPIKQSFLLSKYPVTNAQYRHFIADGGYSHKEHWHEVGWQWRSKYNIEEPACWRDSKWNGETQPVVGVSWWEADAFCRWLSQSVPGCRLPTEQEWEAAARGPSGFEYPWGQWEDGRCNSHEAGLGVTSPVGVFPRGVAEHCGAEDMAGNVWEWCVDAWDPKEREDPNAGRVLRGGSFGSHVDSCRSANRVNLHPSNRNAFGLCVART